MPQSELFQEPAALPSGLVYVPQFLSADEEACALAGIAALELHEALIINPYDERGFADAVARSLQMPSWERRRRMQSLRRRVAGRDVLAWASNILDRLERRKGQDFLAG